MKKRIALLLSLLIIVTVSLIACDKSIHHWEFAHEYTEVSSIQIMKGSLHTTKLDFTELAKEVDLSLAQQLLDDVQKLKYKKYGWNPAPTMSRCGYIVFINFNNGDRDVIAESEPEHFLSDEKDIAFSWLYCPEEQFTALIQKYLGDAMQQQ